MYIFGFVLLNTYIAMTSALSLKPSQDILPIGIPLIFIAFTCHMLWTGTP